MKSFCLSGEKGQDRDDWRMRIKVTGIQLTQIYLDNGCQNGVQVYV